jgi:hypothetical protein
LDKNTTIAIAQQVIPMEDRELTVRDFFKKYHKEHSHNVDVHINNVLNVVNLKAPLERIIKSFSG